MTYNLCKTLVEKGLYNTAEKKQEMQLKLDVFLLNNRITEVEYAELIAMLG